ncbi:MAG TPA: hypothetical protein PKA53_06020 [Sphingobacterium sp.]|nr:hypothetical protein [Sphingobacterium sp.]
MKRQLITVLFLLFSFSVLGQDSTENTLKKLGKNPLIIIDGNRVTVKVLAQYEPEDIATFAILLDTTATNKYGYFAKDGAVIVETVPFSKNKFMTHFKRISPEFENLCTQHPDSLFVFVLGDSVLNDNYEGNLSMLCENDKVSHIDIIPKNLLESKFNKQNGDFGIIIHVRDPDEEDGIIPEQEDKQKLD